MYGCVFACSFSLRRTVKMYSTFGGFSSYFKRKASVIDNTTFRLHYRVTFAFLMIGSLLVTLGQFFGAPIQCIVDGIPGGTVVEQCLRRKKSTPLHPLTSLLMDHPISSQLQIVTRTPGFCRHHEHLLLDPRDLHDSVTADEACGRPGCPSGRRPSL